MRKPIGVTMNQWTDAPAFTIFMFPMTRFMRKRLTALPLCIMYAFRTNFTAQIIIKYKEHDEVCQVFLMKNTVIECKLIRYSVAGMTEIRVVNS